MSLPTMLAQCAFVSLPGDPAPVFSDLSSRIISFKSQRGRNMELDEVETGMCTPDLDNRDRALDPSNTSSAYYPNVLPVKAFSLSATFPSGGPTGNFGDGTFGSGVFGGPISAGAGIIYPIFRGDIEDWPQIWDPTSRNNHSEFNVLDAFDPLKDADVPVTFIRGEELSGARISAILTAAGWPGTQRIVDAGQSLMQAEDLTSGPRKALEMLKEVSVSESGLIFIDASGNFVFHDRHRRIKPPYNTSQVTLSNVPSGGEFPYIEAKLEDSKTLIKNDVTVPVQGGASYNAQDAASISKYRPRSYSTPTVILSSAVEAQLKAQWVLGIYKDAQYRVPYVKIAPQMDDNLWAHALGRELGDRMTVKVAPPGGGAVIQHQATIERIEHNYQIGEWITTWFLSPADSTVYWILGTSALGTDTRLAY